MAAERSNLFLVAAFMAWMLAGYPIYTRLAIAVNGTVISSQVTCVQPRKNRCVTRYVVRSTDGTQTNYAAGAADGALQRDMPVGTVISKARWSFAYFLNGERVDDFPVVFYSGLILLGVLCIGLWVVRFNPSLSRQRF